MFRFSPHGNIITENQPSIVFMNAQLQSASLIPPEVAEMAGLFPAYEMSNLIASGGMVAVYCATHRGTRKTNGPTQSRQGPRRSRPHPAGNRRHPLLAKPFRGPYPQVSHITSSTSANPSATSAVDPALRRSPCGAFASLKSILLRSVPRFDPSKNLHS